MTAAADWIQEQVMIPDLLRAAPQVRPVLDRYGLRGCGGALGPVESLGFFAKAHDVPVQRLVRELREAYRQPAPAEKAAPTLADTIYRPFFLTGIAVVLTLGAAWGAYLLLRIGWAGSFAAVGLHEVNAHGHAQIFGWVGLFVMGFAYQAFPRFKHTSLSHPRLAYLSLGLMAAGLIARSVSEPLVSTWPGLLAVAVGGSVWEVVAIGLFVGIILATLWGSGKPLVSYDYYILSALAWFVLQAIADTLYLTATLTAADREHLLRLVGTWQGPLREMQIHGFALLMILGVSQRIFHYFYGFPEPDARLSRRALVALNAAIGGEVLGLVLMRTHGHGWAALWYASVLLLAGTVFRLVGNWHLFSTPEESDRSLKFLRAAYVWLFVSLGMLVLLPAYQYVLLPGLAPDSAARRMGFSHAYYGAIRHAITVGFISLMIVGVAGKVVPTLNGVDVRALAPLWVPFLLLNTGCALRVVAQTLTDFTGSAFAVAGVSGCLEVAGLAVWGAHLWRIMQGRARLRPNHPGPNAGYTWLLPGSPIVAGNRVGEVLQMYPHLLPVFLDHGFNLLANPFLRKTLARYVTIAAACRKVGVDAPPFLAALNAARQPRQGGSLSLPVIAGR